MTGATMTDPRTVVFNGKFLSERMTGVGRVAEELIRATDRLRAEGHPLANQPFELIRPEGSRKLLSLRTIVERARGRLPRIAWEQLALPRIAQGALLVNLCNLAPLSRRGDLVMIHDVQARTSPESYSRAFVTWYRWALPILGRRAARVLTVSDHSRHSLAAFGIAPLDRIAVIPNGVDHILRCEADPGAVQRLNLDPHRFVLSQATTQRHKNIGLLLRAFADPRMAQLKLVLFGGAKAEDFQRQGLPVPDNIVFAGQVSDAELRGLMEASLCYGCPSRTEGFGLPPLETMLAGSPAVVSDAGALPSTCGPAAIYASADDHEPWISAFLQLDSDPDYRRIHIEQGQAHAAQFTWARSALMLLEHISQFVTPASAAGSTR